MLLPEVTLQQHKKERKRWNNESVYNGDAMCIVVHATGFDLSRTTYGLDW